jgi:23S rRNA-/tRNA-specific pseudouridylate synthase
VLLFTVRREVQGEYQTMFARGEVRKTYLARVAVDPGLELPVMVKSRIVKEHREVGDVSESAVEPVHHSSRVDQGRSGQSQVFCFGVCSCASRFVDVKPGACESTMSRRD